MRANGVTFADPDGGDVVGDAGVGGEHHHAQHGEGGPGQGHQQRHEPHLSHRQTTTDRCRLGEFMILQKFELCKVQFMVMKN